MGLFSRFKGKNKDEKPKKVKEGRSKKAKGGKKGKAGKREQESLVERMQLEESVAVATIDVIEELAGMDISAIREIDDGYLVVVVTNDMLESAGIDPSDEEFGSFAEALRSETIESITLEKDLADGVIGIIPTDDTLLALDEYDFVGDIAFKWGVVPFTLSDEDQIKVLESEVDLAKLIDMANDQSIQVRVEGDDVFFVEGELDDAPVLGADEPDEDEDDNTYDPIVEDPVALDTEPEVEQDDLDEIEIQDEPEFDEPEFDDLDEMDEIELSDDPLDITYDEYDDTGDYEDGVDLPDVDGFDDETSSDDYDTFGVDDADDLTSEDVVDTIERVSKIGFNNTELDVEIDVSLFDTYFDTVDVAQFDTTSQDTGELHDVIRKLRQDANAELRRFHQENVVSLRNTFISTMRDAHNKLVEALDHKDTDTPYGLKFSEIENDYEDKLDDIERLVANEAQAIMEQYKKDREEYAENARREAEFAYDSRYRDARDQKVEAVRDHVQTELQTTRDTDIGELYRDRQVVAKRLYDKATTALLRDLQEQHQEIAERELEMFDAFRKDMDAYLRRHFADEVLRAKAEAEALRQSHEAERVRAEYEAMLTAKAKQLEERDSENRANIRNLESSHKQQLEDVIADYDSRIKREQRENQNLREMLQESNRTNAKIGEQKDKEIEHNMTLLKNTLQATQDELSLANERAKTAQKPMWLVIIAVGAIAIALGIIIGFMYGANSTYTLPVYEQTSQPESVTYYEVEDNPLIINPLDNSLV